MFNLLHYKNAAFPCIAVETCEEDRFVSNLRRAKEFQSIPSYSISATGGLRDLKATDVGTAVVDKSAVFQKAFSFIAAQDGAILVVFDLQHIIKNPVIYRALKDCFGDLKHRGSMIILVAPAWALPAELSHDVPILQFDLPTREQLGRALDVVRKNAGVEVENRDSLLDAAAGLALQEAENAFALSLVSDKALLPETVEREKMRLVKSSGFLEVSAVVPESSLGGLGNLKSYINDEVLPSKGDVLLQVRGMLLVGVPGTGKSWASRVLGSMMGYPVCRMDVGSLKAGIVGQSESNMRQALKLVDAIAPAVLWLDEIEKGVGGHASSAQSDGGTTLGMIGQLLTWLQEHTSPVICIATCNDYAKLPAELTRAGRFDERFFVDLPSADERREIAIVHLRKYADVSDVEAAALHISSITDQWTGAEIEQLIKSASRKSSHKVSKAVLDVCSKEIKPISRVKADEITKLRDWAKDTLRMANTPQAARVEGGRKVSVQ
jgi:hypothetical protein